MTHGLIAVLGDRRIVASSNPVEQQQKESSRKMKVITVNRKLGEEN